MDLNKKLWTASDIQELENYLYSLKNDEKIEWTKNIINTSYPVLAIKLDIIRNIAKQILKGNFESFLQYFLIAAFFFSFLIYLTVS